ncbi:hypothetical protein Q8A67_016794 [Cirrhinus molitorella]|uniref:Uncharacterized protein n=1 Tax=Cirrhinus molitorella TaxID=172907 RepID=A0AA88PIP8_9TELE|nr:hypothetical protein Q8A67_016794 [Cirrhinus molitorella]
MIAAIVNLRLREGAEAPDFIYSCKNAREGFPKVRVFDEAGGEIRGIPIRDWATLADVEEGDESDRGSIIPRGEEHHEDVSPRAPLPDNPYSMSEEFSPRSREPLRIYFGRGENVIILKDGCLQNEEEACVLVNQDERAGEGRSDQGAGQNHEGVEHTDEDFEEESDPEWPELKRVRTSRERRDQVENPFAKLKHGRSFDTFRLGKGSYRPTHSKSRKNETLLDQRDMWNKEYALGITCGQVWSLLNGGDAVKVLADTTLTQRAKRAILAQKDLTNKAALERIIRSAVGNDIYNEYYSDISSEEESSSQDLEDEDQEDSDYERLVTEIRPIRTSTPARLPPSVRQIRFRDSTPEPALHLSMEVQQPVGASVLDQHLQALHLGTPGQRRPSAISSRPETPTQPSVNSSASRVTLEELMRKDQEMKLLKKAKLKNTTTSPEELERALNRYDRKTEMIQSDREKLSSKQQRPRELPRRSNRERKPHRRYETESRPPPHSPRRTERGHKRYEERVDRDNPNFHNSERKRFRNLPRNRVHRSDNDKEKSGYVSPEKWNKLTTEERARIMAEREKGRSSKKIGMFRVEKAPDQEKIQEKKTKKNKKKKDEETEFPK